MKPDQFDEVAQERADKNGWVRLSAIEFAAYMRTAAEAERKACLEVALNEMNFDDVRAHTVAKSACSNIAVAIEKRGSGFHAAEKDE